MLPALMSQVVAGPASWGLMQWLIAVIIIAAAIAVVWVALRKFGIVIPEWVVTIFWIVVVAVVAVVAIRFLFTL